MKRSEINALIMQAIAFIHEMHFKLPPFAFWGMEEWKRQIAQCDEIKDCMLGWDITDFGSGDFLNTGLLLFTIRNGNMKKPAYSKPYAEKLMWVEEEQVTPCHFHWSKMEDIINRGGGNLLIRVHNSTPDERLADTPVRISSDGRNYEAPAGTVITLKPGESITLHAGQYHSFWGQAGAGKTLVGEVSMVNDDYRDNRFLEPAGRFPTIEEDVEPCYLLCTDYDKI